MAFSQPRVLIFGHSFVRRLHRDLRAQFDIRAAFNFNLHHVSTTLHGVGGRTVEKLIKHDFQFVQRFQPLIIILRNNNIVRKESTRTFPTSSRQASQRTLQAVDTFSFVCLWRIFLPPLLAMNMKII